MGTHVQAEEVPGCRGPDGAIGSLMLRVETRGLVIVSVDGVNEEANKHLNKVYRKGWEPLKFG
jgi:hypothetical protein